MLEILCHNNQVGIKSLIHYMKRSVNEKFWRSKKRADWSMPNNQQERSLTGFSGLKNLGCTCYMNSILQ